MECIQFVEKKLSLIFTSAYYYIAKIDAFCKAARRQPFVRDAYVVRHASQELLLCLVAGRPDLTPLRGISFVLSMPSTP